MAIHAAEKITAARKDHKAARKSSLRWAAMPTAGFWRTSFTALEVSLSHEALPWQMKPLGSKSVSTAIRDPVRPKYRASLKL